MNEIKSLFAQQKKQLSSALIVFINISRVIFLVSCFISPQKAVFSIVSFFLTYLISFCHIISKEGSFLNSLSHRITVLICVSSLVSCFIGQTLGVLSKIPEYDIVMSAVTGVTSTLFGYYITLSLKSINKKRDCGFVSSSALFISGTVIFFREMIEFFCDFFFGTNFSHVEWIGDDHWFFRLFGICKSVQEQRPLYDTDEDILISLLASGFTVLFIYLYIKRKHKELFVKAEVRSFSFKALPLKSLDKVYYEIEKVKADTNIYDILAWWLTRSAMLYAFILMEDPLEKVLIGANLLATFAVTLIHLIFPKDSVFCRINYRMQSWLCLIVFTGSYMGNFIFVYNNLPRFDLFLHFISGPIAVAGGYYIAKIFLKLNNRHNIFLAVLYSFCLSCFVMPFWEVFEFLGDFLFSTANQGFYWGPTDDSFFFRVFGHGVGNTMLYYLFDTVYDVLLALLTTVISTIWLCVTLLLKLNKSVAIADSTATEEKITASC